MNSLKACKVCPLTLVAVNFSLTGKFWGGGKFGQFVKLGFCKQIFEKLACFLLLSYRGLASHCDTLPFSPAAVADLHVFLQINASVESNWLHVSSDASRLAIIWKYGGIYMDTDVISIRPIPEENFLAAQSSQYSSNGVFGFLPHHPFLWECMENFVEHYNSDIWGNQGPSLMTRMLRLWCKLRDFQEVSDFRCLNLSFLHPQRFYPISYPEWRRYYEVWDKDLSFNDSYALHLWNYMNNEGRTVVRGSNTLVENLCRKHCPRTYRDLIQSPEGSVTGEVGPGNK